MKKILLTTLLLGTVGSYTANAQWSKISTKTYSDIDFYDIHASGDIITAVGFKFNGFQGHVLRSTNAGQTWDTMQGRSGVLFKTITFKDADTGYIGGYGNRTFIYRSGDKGANWEQYIVDTANGGINDMAFIDGQHGFATGYSNTQFFSGQCYRTYDGGQIWWYIDDVDLGPLDSVGLDNMQFLDPQTGYAYTSLFFADNVVKTTDSGKTWQYVRKHQDAIVGLHFFNANNGILLDAKDQIYRTTDGGQTWNNTGSISNNTGKVFTTMAFLNQNLGFAGGESGVMFKTTDGGQTWTQETSVTNETLFRIKFFDNRAYATGTNGVVLRTAPIPNSVNEIAFAEQLSVYPNPANTKLYISSYKGMYADMNVVITDITGKAISTHTATNGNMMIDTHELPAGQYLLNIQAGDKSHTEKIVISH